METIGIIGGGSFGSAIADIAGTRGHQVLHWFRDPAAAERVTGYVVGGISPLGQKRAHPTVLDESALVYDTVYVSGGRRGLDLSLSPKDLARLKGILEKST